MLEYNHEDDAMLYGLMSHFRCDIMIPQSMSDFFDTDKSHAIMADERRRYKRWTFRNLAVLEHRQSLNDLKRSPSWYRIYTKDISISGIAFLHSEQLFPLEQMRIILPKESVKPLFKDHNTKYIEVLRCRKWGERCYEVGAQFVDKLRD